MLFPINSLLTYRGEIGIGLTKVFISKPITAISTQWRRVSRGKYTMLLSINQGYFLFGKTAPKKEDDMLTIVRYTLDDSIGESFPALSLMTTCRIGTDSKGSVQQ